MRRVALVGAVVCGAACFAVALAVPWVAVNGWTPDGRLAFDAIVFGVAAVVLAVLAERDGDD